jgi:hypothetical protein
MVGVVPDGTKAAFIHSGTSVSRVVIHDEEFTHRDSLLIPPDHMDLKPNPIS